ncbi:MAG TPA: MFS transporter [Anaerolineaceae bacterium]|nr:MFS transporter [Anaerolineaceae bacterium]
MHLSLSSTIAPLRSFSKPARLFLIATIIDGIIYSSWTLFFNIFILARGFDKQYLGLVNSAPSVAALLLGIPLGLLSDRIGRRKAMLLGILVATIALAGQVIVVRPALIIALAFIGGLGNSLYTISQAPFMMRASTPQNRTLLFSLNFGLTTIAGSLGSLFAGQLPDLFSRVFHIAGDSASAYQAVLLASVLLGSISLIPIFLIREPGLEAQPTQRQAPRPLNEVFFRSLVLKIAFPNLLIGLGAAILIPYMNVFFVERFHTSNQDLGVLFAISSLLIGVGSFTGPRLAANLGSKIKAVVFTQGTSLVFLLLTGFSPVNWLAAAGLLVRGMLMNMAYPLYNAFSMEQIATDEQGAVNSLLGLTWQIGFAIGPYISGVVQEKYGFTPLFIATTVLYFAATLFSWLFLRKMEAAPHPETVGMLTEAEPIH